MPAKTYSLYFYPVIKTAKGITYSGQSLEEIKILLNPAYGSDGACFAQCEQDGELVASRARAGADVEWVL